MIKITLTQPGIFLLIPLLVFQNMYNYILTLPCYKRSTGSSENIDKIEASWVAYCHLKLLPNHQVPLKTFLAHNVLTCFQFGHQ